MNQWESLVVNEMKSIKEAIGILNGAALKILFVLNNQKQLVGTITDGDIRRGILANIGLDKTVKDIMNKSPVSVSTTTTKDKILSLMEAKGIIHIPIVNETKNIIGLATHPAQNEKTKHPNRVVLMAGGFGSRLENLTEQTPKPLLKVGDQPILETILTQLINQGFEYFYISTHYKAEMVEAYFGDGSKWGIKIEYIKESQPLGTAGALGLLPKDLDHPLLVMNGDLLTKIDFESLLNFHEKEGALVTACTTEYKIQIPFGVVETKNNQVNKIVEKPTHRFFVNAGIYIVNPEFLHQMDGKDYMDMPNLLQKNIEQGKKINVFPIFEYWLDVGNLSDYKKGKVEYREQFIDR